MMAAKMASDDAQQLANLIFGTAGFKKITEFRERVLQWALFAGGPEKENYRTEKAHWMSRANKAFVAGWEAAGGGDLLYTWHYSNGQLCYIFWREDPADLLEKLVREHRPDMVVKSVQSA